MSRLELIYQQERFIHLIMKEALISFEKADEIIVPTMAGLAEAEQRAALKELAPSNPIRGMMTIKLRRT